MLRTMFHELAHGASRDLLKVTWVAERNPVSPNNHFNTTAEAIAIDAENLAYTRNTGITDNGIRVGHSNDPRPRSNNPIAPFSGSGHVTYLGGGRLIADQEGGQIGKSYKRANFTVALSGTPTNLINYITIDATGPIFTSTGGASRLLDKAFDGIAHDNALQSTVLPFVTGRLGDLNKAADVVTGGIAISALAALGGVRASDVHAAVGLTNELSMTEEPITGPHVPNGAGYDPAKQLYLEAINQSTGTLIIGGSGARQLNVDYRQRTDYLMGSSGNDILLAGTGRSPSGTAVNMLYGESGNDVLVGNLERDQIEGGAGTDIIFQSLGRDSIDGGSEKDAFVLANGAGSQIVDLRTIAADGSITLKIGPSVSIIKNVEIFVGNDSFTTFIGDGRTTFVAGAGGADFTLRSGDVAIGDPSSRVGNIYRVRSLDLGKIRILNFKINDELWVDGKRLTDYRVTSSVSESKLYPDNPRSPDIIQNGAGLQTNISGAFGGTLESLRFSSPGQFSYGAGTGATLIELIPSSDLPDSVVQMTFGSLQSDGGVTNGLNLVISGYKDGYGGIRIRSDELSLVRQMGALEDFGKYFWSGHLYQDLRGLYVGSQGARPYSKQAYSPFSAEWQNITQRQGAPSYIMLSDYSSSLFAQTMPQAITGSGHAAPVIGDISATAYRDPDTYSVSVSDVAAVTGDTGANVLDAAGGYNMLVGNGGGDAFIYAAGYGLVAIDEQDTALLPNNRIEFGVGLDPESAIVFGDEEGNIVLDFGNEDVLVIKSGLYPVSSSGVSYGVQLISFSDGTQWDYYDLIYRAGRASESNRTLVGDWQSNILDSDGIADLLVGNGGGDTFKYAPGYGRVVIDERDAASNPVNVLAFDEQIAPETIRVSGTESGDLVLEIGYGDDVVTVKGGLKVTDASGISYGVQSFAFADGTVWTYEDVLALALAPVDGKSTLFGDARANEFDGAGIATRAVGNGGGDIFYYDAGYGYLRIDELDRAATPDNRLVFGAGVDKDHIAVAGDASGNLTLILSSTDVIVLTGALNSAGTTTYGVQHIAFDDGTIWSYADLLARALAPTTDKEALFGDRNGNIIDSQGMASTLTGGGGGDTFVYNAGYGAVTILEVDGAVAPVNILQLGAGISKASLSVVGSADGDLVLTFGDGDIVTLIGGLNSQVGSTFGVQSLHFADGSTISYADLLELAATASLSNRAIYGDHGADILDTAGVATRATGGGGGDVFVYQRGYGAVAIDERDAESSPANSIHFGAGIVVDELSVFANADGDIHLSLGDGDDITLVGALLSLDGVTNGVQILVFDDGTSLSYHDLLLILRTASAGNVVLYGDTDANTLDAAGIATTLVGNGGGDTFLYATGYGRVIIDERDATGYSNNLLQLGDGLGPANVTISGNAADDLFLDFGNGDSVTLKGALKLGDAKGVTYGIQEISFADGTVWSYADILDRATNASATNTSLYGDTGANTLAAQGLAHLLVGNGGGDTFVFNIGDGAVTIDEQDAGVNRNELTLGGGIYPHTLVVTGNDLGDLLIDLGSGDLITLKGALLGTDAQGITHGIQSINFADGAKWGLNELLEVAATPSLTNTVLYGNTTANIFDSRGIASRVIGNGGRDTIYYNQGYGNLEIDEKDTSTNPYNRLIFGEGIDPTDVSVSANSSGSIALTLGATDNITLVKALNSTESVTYGLQAIEFANGTVWDTVTLKSFLAGEREIDLSSSDLRLDFAGLPASQLPELVMNVLPAEISVSMSADGQSLRLATLAGGVLTLDHIFGSNARINQTIRFSDGTIWYIDDAIGQITNWQDVGSVLFGTTAAESFSAFGHFNVIDGGGGGDTFHFERGDGELFITQADLAINTQNRVSLGAGLSLTDLVITSDSLSEDTLKLDFGTGDAIYLLAGLHIDGTSSFGVQTLTFFDGLTLDYHELVALANIGTAQNSGPLIGDTYANVIDTGGWSHSAQGNGGGDTFVYNAGYGPLFIDEADTDRASDNVLRLGPGLMPTDLLVVAEYTSLRLTFPSDDQIVLYDVLNNAPGEMRGVQRVIFDDGTILTSADLLVRAGILISVVGDSDDNVLSGTAGSDNLDGAGGNDTLTGIAGNDVLTGGTGNDILTGGGGDDVYRYAPGDGMDIVNDYGDGSGGAGGTDAIQFAVGILPSDVGVTQANTGTDLLLTIAGGGTITLQGTILEANKRIEQVRFADGTVWSYADLMARATTPTSGDDVFYGDVGAQTLEGGAGADALYGRGGDDRLIGGTGNDILSGANGSDVYVFARGDGQDRILADPRGGVTNAIEFGAGIAPADVLISTANSGHDIVVGLIDSTDTITIAEMNTDPTKGIDEIRFANGTTWTYSDIMARRTSATDGNDMISGTSGDDTLFGAGGNDTLTGIAGNDVLTGGTGNDILTGGGGDDVYRYALGDGMDIVNDYGDGSGGAGGTDAIQFAVGILPSDVGVTQANIGTDLLLTIAGGGTISLQGTILEANKRIEQVRFADGTVWSYADLMARATTPTSGDDVFYGDVGAQTLEGGAGADALYGRGGDDRLIGGTGNDTLSGANGSDVYVFARDDGQDRILADPRGGVTNAIEFGAGIAPADVLISTANSGHDIVVGLIDSTDTITIAEMNIDPTKGIDEIRFANGTTWTYSDIMALADSFTGGVPHNNAAFIHIDESFGEFTEIAPGKMVVSTQGEVVVTHFSDAGRAHGSWRIEPQVGSIWGQHMSSYFGEFVANIFEGSDRAKISASQNAARLVENIAAFSPVTAGAVANREGIERTDTVFAASRSGCAPPSYIAT